MTYSDRLQWQVAAASVTGARHLRSGHPGQDVARYRAYRTLGTPLDTLVAAVADGAGSAPLGGPGATLAANAAIHTVVERLRANPNHAETHFLECILLESILVAIRRIAGTARKEGRHIRDFATTLLIAIQVNGTLATAQIGDGAIVAGDGSGSYHLITNPDRGEYANTTNFITGRNALSVCQIIIEPGLRPEQIAMFTDGIQNLVLDNRAGIPHAPFFNPTFDWLEQQPDELQAYTGLRSFLLSSRVQERSDDDITLLLARRC